MDSEEQSAALESVWWTSVSADTRIAGDVGSYLAGLHTVVATLPRKPLERLTALLVRASQEGRTVLILGNGGSAATASHMACDLAKTAAVVGMSRLRAVALTDNMPLITAIGNDIGYERVFSEQLRVFARPGDLAIIFSASGNSPNVLVAAEAAHDLGVMVVGITGFGGGKLHAMSDLGLVVESAEYGPVEDAHMIVVHTLTAALRAALTRLRSAPHAGHAEVEVETADGVGPRAALPAAREPRTIFVDRDGVINRNSDDYVKRWSEFEFLPGALEGLARLRRAGHRVFVITNQACIAKGLTTQADVEDIHHRMRQAVEQAGGYIEDVLLCPHHPQDHCDCRKPAPGLIARARDQYGLDLSRAVFIGDSTSDMDLAQRVGIPSLLVLSGLGWATATALPPRKLRACRVALSLHHAVQVLLGEGAEDEAMLRALIRQARAGQWAAARRRTRNEALPEPVPVIAPGAIRMPRRTPRRG